MQEIGRLNAFFHTNYIIFLTPYKALVVQRVDNFFQQISHHPADKVYCLENIICWMAICLLNRIIHSLNKCAQICTTGGEPMFK